MSPPLLNVALTYTSPLATLGIPRIEQRNACTEIMHLVTTHDRKSMASGGRGDQQIGLREGIAALASILKQHAPFENDLFRDRQGALQTEHRTHFERQPIQQGRPLVDIRAQVLGFA